MKLFRRSDVSYTCIFLFKELNSGDQVKKALCRRHFITMGVRRGGTGICSPLKLGLRTKISSKPEVSSLFPINRFTFCNNSSFAADTHTQWRAEGGERGSGLGHPRQGGIQKVKLQKFKCCNSMIFSIVSLLIYAAWI